MKKPIKITTSLLVLFFLLFVTPAASVDISASSLSEAAEKVHLSKTSAVLLKNQSLRLVLHGTDRKDKIVWKSSKRAVATVNSQGTVKGIKRGTAVVQAAVKGKLFQCKVVVEAPKLSKTSVRLVKGKTLQLKLSGTRQKVVWKSSKRAVATVSAKGIIKANKSGTAIIQAGVKGKQYRCKVTVEAPKISKTSARLTKGKTLQLKLSGTKQKVAWKSSKQAVAVVNSKGRITAKKAGKATISAIVQGKRYSCSITVRVPAAAPVPPQDNNIYVSNVWLSATGTKYHVVPDCGNMNPSKARAVSRGDAIRGGFDPCDKCF